MKKFICIILTSFLTVAFTLGSTSIKAGGFKAFKNSNKELLQNNTLVINSDDFKYTIYEDDEQRKVITYDKLNNLTYTSIYDKKTNIVKDENGNYLGTGYVVSYRGIYGPFKAYFDINPTSVGAIVGTILAIAAVVSTAGSAGVGIAALKAGLDKLIYVGGAGSLASTYFSDCSINGYFQYSQELSSNAKKARNINRYFYARVGYKNSYNKWNFGNGGWFDAVKPY